VNGVSREARVVSPGAASPHPPIVFCFHGGGGQAYYAVDEYAIHKNWPEALVYYAQGLVGPGGFSTWTARDTAFFDAMRTDAVHRRSGDPKRLFVMGYSTGANFCGDLWASRGPQIAGFAFVSGGRFSPAWPPRPVYLNYAAGEPEAPRLRALGAALNRAATKAGVRLQVVPRSGAHTYPQPADVEIAAFLRSCPPVP
jgi:polyhydroxybutyrate depolymerase